MLCRTTQSSDAHRTESVSVMDHQQKQTIVVNSKVLDQKQLKSLAVSRCSGWLFTNVCPMYARHD